MLITTSTVLLDVYTNFVCPRCFREELLAIGDCASLLRVFINFKHLLGTPKLSLHPLIT